ncbi:hypothetical protein [Aquihabitans sp. McL0605]|uniref:hypothetical protein n=1 Tax=Aquihabitans sp. McL0605 TaxID=3415671 RepID=UPI003CEF44C8
MSQLVRWIWGVRLPASIALVALAAALGVVIGSSESRAADALPWVGGAIVVLATAGLIAVEVRRAQDA